jgi:hypothetical protein
MNTSVADPWKFWYGSGCGSADPYLWLMDPESDPDPATFVSDLQDINKKLFGVWIRIRGSMPLTNGSGFGSGSPKNIWILRIRIKIRIRIRSTDEYPQVPS